nr:MAG TPA: Mn-containing catalase [Caudoviricetes sp.]
MFIFEKRTQIPVCIKNRNPKLAGIILSQYGGPDGELSASLRYLSQRFTMPDNMGKSLLTDIGTEELAHRWYQWIQKNLPSKWEGFL